MPKPCRLLLLAIALSGALGGVARADEGDPFEVAYPVLAAQAASLEAFAPAGWRLEFVQRGGLDGDRRDDAVFVLRMQDPRNILQNDGLGESEFDTNPRILGVAFAEGDGYRLALQDQALIPRPDSPTMDDYLEDEEALAIRRGAFTVTLHAWASAGSWGTSNTTFTFRQQEGCFRLIGYDDSAMQRNSGESTDTSVNYVTGKATITTGSMEDDATETTKHALPKQPLRCLQEIGSGFEFDPGVHAEPAG